jgi:hypothetical protein
VRPEDHVIAGFKFSTKYEIEQGRKKGGDASWWASSAGGGIWLTGSRLLSEVHVVFWLTRLPYSTLLCTTSNLKLLYIRKLYEASSVAKKADPSPCACGEEPDISPLSHQNEPQQLPAPVSLSISVTFKTPIVFLNPYILPIIIRVLSIGKIPPLVNHIKLYPEDEIRSQPCTERPRVDTTGLVHDAPLLHDVRFVLLRKMLLNYRPSQTGIPRQSIATPDTTTTKNTALYNRAF